MLGVFFIIFPNLFLYFNPLFLYGYNTNTMDKFKTQLDKIPEGKIAFRHNGIHFYKRNGLYENKEGTVVYEYKNNSFHLIMDKRLSETIDFKEATGMTVGEFNKLENKGAI